MKRGPVLAASLLLCFSALFVQAVALPWPVRACSCMPNPPGMAELAAEGGLTVVAGTVGRALPDRTPVSVDTWFHGDAPSDVVWVSGGSQQMTSCDPVMTAGERRLLVLHGEPGQLYSSNPCVTSGVIGTANGDAALAEAAAVFGTGIAPPTAEPEPTPQAPPTPAAPAGDGLLWVAAAVGAASLLFFSAVVLARRREPR
ncbi:MAG: hypothetical protein M3N29_06960 [Chloroflexota bacterium]|nr:hypothetical protein [Chloroflexota bacterium]